MICLSGPVTKIKAQNFINWVSLSAIDSILPFLYNKIILMKLQKLQNNEITKEAVI